MLARAKKTRSASWPYNIPGSFDHFSGCKRSLLSRRQPDEYGEGGGAPLDSIWRQSRRNCQRSSCYGDPRIRHPAAWGTWRSCRVWMPVETSSLQQCTMRSGRTTAKVEKPWWRTCPRSLKKKRRKGNVLSIFQYVDTVARSQCTLHWLRICSLQLGKLTILQSN